MVLRTNVLPDVHGVLARSSLHTIECIAQLTALPAFPWPERRKLLVYTSFDGDHMHYLDFMCEYALRAGCVPINPEAALGYYISTMALGEEKVEVMRDCIALELACDEMWAFSKTDGQGLADLPEGVLAEFEIWYALQTGNPARHFPILSPATLHEHRQAPYLSLQMLREHFTVSHQEVLNAASHYGQTYFQDLESRLLHSVRAGQLRPLAYLSTAPEDYKHLDWARVWAYRMGYVPFGHDAILKPSIAYETYGEKHSQERAVDRLSLVDRAQEYWVFGKHIDFLSALPTLSGEARSEISYWLENRGMQTLRYFSWQDVEVPKYSPGKRWALTAEEHRQIQAVSLHVGAHGQE